MVLTVYKSACHDWAKAFKEGRTDTADEECRGRPADISTPEMIKEVEKLVLADRRATIDDIAEGLVVSHGTAHKIVHATLEFNKVSARWVPKMLTDVHKQRCLMVAKGGCEGLKVNETAFWTGQ